jgi:hypothetical protein
MNLANRLKRRLDNYASTIEALWIGTQMAGRLPTLLKQPITFGQAAVTVKERFGQREKTFLYIAQKGIYEHPESPYRGLMLSAGCEYGDLEKLVLEEGVEGALQVLFRRGIYLTVGEFKGRQPAVRGSQTIQIDPGKVRNPLSTPHVLGRTSGSRSARTLVAFDLAFIRDCAVNHCLGLGIRGGEQWVKANWEGPGGGANFRLVKFSCLGSPPACWFLRGGPALQDSSTRWTARFMQLGHRLSGASLPSPLYVPHDDPLPIAQWMASVLRSGRTPYLFGFASSAVRLCQTAYEAGIDLQGAQFQMGGEPITDARLEVVRRVGADGIPRYGSVETGMIGYGCPNPEFADDMHLFHDLYAIVQAETVHEHLKIPKTALFISSLLPTSPFILLNVCMGDQAYVEQRACGCPMEEFGWMTHLHTVRSYEKLTAAGITLWDTEVIRVLEEVLPSQFGGGPTSYQLVEDEINAQPRLTLRVDPTIGPADVDDIGKAFFRGIHVTGNRLWQTPGFFRVKRQAPMTAGSGKILHLHLQQGSST